MLFNLTQHLHSKHETIIGHQPPRTTLLQSTDWGLHGNVCALKGRMGMQTLMNAWKKTQLVMQNYTKSKIPVTNPVQKRNFCRYFSIPLNSNLRGSQKNQITNFFFPWTATPSRVIPPEQLCVVETTENESTTQPTISIESGQRDKLKSTLTSILPAGRCSKRLWSLWRVVPFFFKKW